nr:tetratricopeptide repeat protein [Neoroseomonas soli]
MSLAAARLARREGRFTDAVALFDDVLARDVGSLAARIERAATLSQARRFEEAAAAIAAVLADVPDHAGAQMEAGFIARGQGRHEDELRHFEAAAATGTAEPWRALIQVSQAARTLGRIARALEAAQEATERAPASAPAWMARALAARAVGDIPAEHAALRRAAEADPTNSAPVMELAQAAVRAGDGHEALALLDEAERRSPRPPLLDVARGHAALAAGKEEEALRSFRLGARRNPAAIGAATGLIHCLLRRHAYANATEALARACARFGDAPELVAQRAALLQAQGRLAEALHALRASYMEAPDNRFPQWEAWFHIERQLGTAEDQAACIRAARPATAPEHAAVARAQALAAEAQFEWTKARQAYDRALALVPEDSTALDGLARVAALHLQAEHALAWLRRQATAEAKQRAREKRSLNPSQTTTGQIALEFRLDRDGSAALRDVLPLPPAMRIAPLFDAVRALPQSTALALWLLITLRQAGRLDAPPDVHGLPAIPRRLLLLRPRNSPAGASEGWQAMNPGLEVMEMDVRAATEYLADRHGEEGRRAWQRTPEGGVRANLVRLAWLAHGGGWSIAAGGKPVTPLDRIAAPGAGFVASQEAWGAPGETLLGAAPGNTVAARAAELAVSALARGDREHPWLRCGPGLLARAVAATLAATPKEIARLRLVPEGEVNRVVHCDRLRERSADDF